MDSQPADNPEPFTPRVTLRQLAQELGLAHSTVSMALRGHPSIAEATKLRVRKAAAKHGYRPEPMLSALAAYRQMKRPPVYHGVLAWVMNQTSSHHYTSVPIYGQYLEGAQWRAASLGFRVEEFVINEPEMSAERLSEILLARGVQGLLVAPQPEANTRLRMRWDWFSAVTFGYSLAEPQLHLVSSTQYRIGMMTTRKLQELGYQRIGFYGSDRFDAFTDRNFTAGFRVASLDVPARRRVPPLLNRHGAATPHENLEALRQWIKEWQIDAVICVAGMQDMLTSDGYRVPEDFAVALAGYQEQYPGYAGMDQRGFHTGAAAVDMLVGMIHRGERGVPEVPYRLLIEGVWKDAPSAPPAAERTRMRRAGKQARQRKPATPKKRK